jgi:hypothetical protein
MILHVLNGDALADNFNLGGEIVICRECLIEGETNANSLEDFWKLRAGFIEKTYGENDYFGKTVREFEKLQNVLANDEVNLWFGNELFCQANLWFCLSLLENTDVEIYRIFPNSNDWSCKFDDLQSCFDNRVKLSNEDLQLGVNLWKAYQTSDYTQLISLSRTNSSAFLRLEEVCQAETEKQFKPRKILSEIIEKGETDFNEIFKQCSQKAPIYGFGDSQVKRLLQTIR